MFIPISDDNSERTITPYVNYILIAMNILVFVFFQGCGQNEKFTYSFSTVPREIVTGKDIVSSDRKVQDPVSGNTYIQPGLGETPSPVYITLLTSMFMHGGIAHLLGNMLFLWIFGDNIENRIRHLRYLIFYLLCGLIASLSHVALTVLTDSNTLVPSLGASGAISGVMGGYILLFPKNRVNLLMFRMLMPVPAYVALGLWFVFQLISGIGLLGGGSQEGGVAYAAHIGGFIAGLVLIKIFEIGVRREGGLFGR
ncbi:MAG: rhomboid family intramembrane serine protease [Ignavibacteriae bacterium]|nr:MAG: rhomboid family intramembrane serine protease [Ignavibacteriota bacterium]